jgi:hypothetical protein
VNVRHADQQVRGTMVMPHGLGKEVKVAVFARRRRRVPTTSARRSLPSGCRAASRTSTWRSRAPT